MSTTCSPKALPKWDVGGQIPVEMAAHRTDQSYISGLVANPYNSREWFVVKLDGFIGTYDVLTDLFA